MMARPEGVPFTPRNEWVRGVLESEASKEGWGDPETFVNNDLGAAMELIVQAETEFDLRTGTGVGKVESVEGEVVDDKKDKE